MEEIAEERLQPEHLPLHQHGRQEEEIDLAATHAKLVEIEKAIQKATSKHNEFLKELGLSPLPSPDSNPARE